MTISEFKEFLPQIKNCPFENLDELFEENDISFGDVEENDDWVTVCVDLIGITDDDGSEITAELYGIIDSYIWEQRELYLDEELDEEDEDAMLEYEDAEMAYSDCVSFLANEDTYAASDAIVGFYIDLYDSKNNQVTSYRDFYTEKEYNILLGIED